MINFEQFLTKYTGTKVDFDGAYGAQCVDLFRQYNHDVFGLGHTGAVTGAKELWTKYEMLGKEIQYYKKVMLFQTGDVVVWDGTEKNPYGHVAIFIASYSTEEILVFEQDGFAQDGAKFARRSTKNLLGALRRR